MGIPYGFNPPSYVDTPPLDDLSVSERVWIKMQEGRGIDAVEYIPVGWTPAKGWMLFLHGSGGSRKTNDGDARTLATGLGCASIAVSMAGQGETGLGLYNPPDKRAHGAFTWLEVCVLNDLMKYGVGKWGTNFAVNGDSQGWRLSMQSRAWAGYTFLADDYPVKQGWATAGEVIPSPKLVFGAGHGANWVNVLVPDYGPLLRGNLFTGLSTTAYQQWDPEGGADQGLYYDPDMLTLLRSLVHVDGSAALKAKMSTDERWKKLHDDSWTRHQASDIPVAWHVSMLEAWYDAQRITDESRTIMAGGGSAPMFLSYSTGNHQSASNTTEQSRRSLREAAMIAYYVQGDSSRLDDMGNNAAAIGDVPGVRMSLLPNTLAAYQAEATVWEEVYAADTDTLYNKTPIKLYLQTNLTLSTSAPSGSASANVHRAWTHGYDAAQWGQRMGDPGADLFRDVVRNGNGLASNEVRFTATISAGLAKVMAGPIRIKDLYVQSNSAKIQLGFQLWIDDGTNDELFLCSGALTKDDLTTGSVQGPYSADLELIGTRLVQGQTLILRVVPWDAKEIDYPGTAVGRMITMPFGTDAEQSIHIAAGSREPYLEVRLFDEATQNGSKFLI